MKGVAPGGSGADGFGRYTFAQGGVSRGPPPPTGADVGRGDSPIAARISSWDTCNKSRKVGVSPEPW